MTHLAACGLFAVWVDLHLKSSVFLPRRSLFSSVYVFYLLPSGFVIHGTLWIVPQPFSFLKYKFISVFFPLWCIVGAIFQGNMPVLSPNGLAVLHLGFYFSLFWFCFWWLDNSFQLILLQYLNIMLLLYIEMSFLCKLCNISNLTFVFSGKLQWLLYFVTKLHSPSFFLPLPFSFPTPCLDRYGLIHQARISASVNAMRVLNTGTEVEAAVADALVSCCGILTAEETFVTQSVVF